MSARSAARRYAAVLFEVVNKSGDVVRAERDLNAFLGLMAGHAQLQKVLTSPAIPAARKAAVITHVLDAAGELTPAVRRLLIMLAERDRLAHLGEVAEAFTAKVMGHQKITDAEIVTAEPLTDASRAALIQKLGDVSGSEVRIQETVDPDILGGLIARVGGVVFDASLTRQLEKMRQRLLAQA